MSGNGSDVLLTGLPRSGTNLSCRLLNLVADTVALAEPMDVQALGHPCDAPAAADRIAEFLHTQRASLLARGEGSTRHSGGAVQDNFFGDVRDAEGLRVSQSERGIVALKQPSRADFTLVVKHPAAFTALLPELVTRFRCYALIRNPLAVLASWNSNRMPVREGHAPAAEAIDARLAAELASIADRMDRQIHLLGWFFERFERCLPSRQLIRYEELVASGGAVLAAIAPAAAGLNEPLGSRNASAGYDWPSLAPVVRRLLDSEGAYWNYYARSDVETLYDAACSRDGPRPLRA